MTSSSTTSWLAISWRCPSRHTTTFGALTSDSRSRVALARYSWTTPITMFRIITKPKRASRHSPRTRTVPISTLMMALNRVKTLARRISPNVRDDRWSLTLTFPSATRWATSAAVSPRGARVVSGLVMRARR